MKPKQLGFRFEHPSDPTNQRKDLIIEAVDDLNDHEVLVDLKNRRPVLYDQYMAQMRDDLISIREWEEE